VSNNNRILIIEDHRDIAEMLYEFFERRGYEMDYASDGQQALNQIVSTHYQLVILDFLKKL